MDDNGYNLNFNFAYGRPDIQASFRELPEDFQVTELFQPCFSGEGEHLYLWIEKTGENTQWVARQLATYYNVPELAIGYCGMKDRHAITRQWFSVHIPGQTALPIPVLQGNINVLEHHWHHKKLRRGDHQGNNFIIRLRSLCPIEHAQNPGSNPIGLERFRVKLDEKLGMIKHSGVPNYFGEQRFGIHGNNLIEADKLLKPIIERQSDAQKQSRGNRGRKNRKSNPRSSVAGIYLSAARSYLFNWVLSQRLAEEDWLTLNNLDNEFKTGPLWGRGRSQIPASLLEIEQQILAPWNTWQTALEFTGLSQERRPLQLMPRDFESRWHQQDLVLSFGLAAGQYATAILREIAVLNSPKIPPVI